MKLRHWFLLGAASAVLAVACSDSSTEKRRVAKLAQGCLIDSDCASPLVCVWRLCHEECAETRDCPDGQRCVPGDNGKNVCLLPIEAECLSNKSCPGRLFCAEDWQCRSECQAAGECVAEQVCSVSGFCAEQSEVDSGGRLVLPDTPSSSSGGQSSGASGGGAGEPGSGGSGAQSADSSGGSSGAGTGGSGASSGGGSSGGASSGGASSGGGPGTGGSGTSGAGSGGTSSDGCPTGTGECDGDPETVCEADLTLVTRCGDCDHSCNGDNATVACQAGACVIVGCNFGHGDCNGKPEDGCEEPLASNAAHCGACGRDCGALGSTCNVDSCDPLPVQASMPIGGDNSNGLTWAYALGSLFQVGYYDYTLRRIPLNGDPLSTIWTGSGNAAARYSLVVNDSDVIWAERSTSGVEVYHKPHTALESDAPSVLFTPQYLPYFLQVHDNAFYWMSGDYQSGDPGGYVYTRAVGAASNNPGVQIVSESQGTHGAVTWFTVGDDAMYWFTTDASENQVRTAPLSGGSPQVVSEIGVIAAGLSTDRVKLRTRGSALYYNRDVDTSFRNGIWRWTPGDSEPTQLVVAEGVLDFVLDEDSIYYLNPYPHKAPLAGGVGVPLGSLAGDRIVHQTEDSLYVVFLSSSTSSVTRVIK